MLSCRCDTVAIPLSTTCKCGRSLSASSLSLPAFCGRSNQERLVPLFVLLPRSPFPSSPHTHPHTPSRCFLTAMLCSDRCWLFLLHLSARHCHGSFSELFSSSETYSLKVTVLASVCVCVCLTSFFKCVLCCSALILP